MKLYKLYIDIFRQYIYSVQESLIRLRQNSLKKEKGIYKSVYAKTKEDVIEKKRLFLGEPIDSDDMSTKMNLLILGAGTHGRDVYEIAAIIIIIAVCVVSMIVFQSCAGCSLCEQPAEL